MSKERNEAAREERRERKKGLSGFQKFALVALVIVLLGSVAARAFTRDEPARRSGATPELAQGFQVGGGTSRTTAEPEGVERALPYLTEASFFGLIGFALGYTVRKIVKIGLMLLAGFFVVTQVLSHYDVMSIDWGGAQRMANQFLFNLQENNTLVEWIKAKAPSGGAFGAGYFLGFRRG